MEIGSEMVRKRNDGKPCHLVNALYRHAANDAEIRLRP
jgi:hypothetical protein